MQQNLTEKVIQALANTAPLKAPEPFEPLASGEVAIGDPLSPPLQALGRLKDEVFEDYQAALRDQECPTEDATRAMVLGGQYQALESLFWTLAVNETGYTGRDPVTIRGNWQLVRVPEARTLRLDLGDGIGVIIFGDSRPFGFCRTAGGPKGFGESTEV